MSTVFTPENKDELKHAVLLWINNKRDALERYGNISQWNTEKITDMGGMFYRATNFNEDIGGWNTSNVTNMSSMFAGARRFNQDAGGIFYRAINFNKHIGRWNTANVTNMSGMFDGASDFNVDIGGWNTANVTNMEGMFEGAIKFNKNIGRWNTAKVTDMSSMFDGAIKFNKDIGRWNTANVTKMNGMFFGATDFNADISEWNTANVTKTNGMFWRATNFNADISEWNTGQVTDMSFMFGEATKFNQDISEWDIENVEYMDGMFLGATDFSYLYSLRGWEIDIPNPTDHGTGDFTDYGEQPNAVAFEVHNIFRKINKSRYIDHLMTFFNGLTPEQRDENPFIISESGNLTFDYWDPTKMKTITHVAFNHYIDKDTPSKKTEENNKFELVFGRITNCAPSAEVKQITNLSIAYMWTSDWSDDERGLYMYKMISDNAEAYTGDVAGLNVSCIQGIFERFVLGLRDMIQIKTDKTPFQNELFSIITNQIPEPNEIYELWREEVKENTQYENIKNIISKRDDNEDIVFDEIEATALQKSYADFMRSKYSVMLSDESTLNAKMNEDQIKQFIDYVPLHIQDGGRKRRQTKKKKGKKSKKSKKSNTKKKKDKKDKKSKKSKQTKKFR